MATTELTLEHLKDHIARCLSDYKVASGEGEVGILSIALAKQATRTFRAHWTGFKIFYPQRVVLLHARLHDGSFWAEGFVSLHSPSWVLAFRSKPHKSRGSGGPRPDDKVTPPGALEADTDHQQRLLEGGSVREEELIRMEDLDDPIEAIDAFFYYTKNYVLKAVDGGWSQIGYVADESIGWEEDDQQAAAVPIDSAIEQGLKRSDILWLTPNTAPDKAIPCWFLYTRDQRLFVLSGEKVQIIPDAEHVRDAHVITRWKGRDVRMGEFDAAVRVITSSDEEFPEVAEQMVGKRQSVRESTIQTVARWMRECVILELKPRV